MSKNLARSKGVPRAEAHSMWEVGLNDLLARLSREEQVICAAGIPGPMLEFRSGALPNALAPGTGFRDYTPVIATVTGLDRRDLQLAKRMLDAELRPANVVEGLRAIADDWRSFARLLSGGIAGVIHRYRGKGSQNSWTGTHEVRLRVANGVVNVEYPANLVSLGLIWEVFCDEAYRITGPVDHIYDCGANIGLAALYFHKRFPSAAITCVEPHPDNVSLLRRNLDRNDVRAEVVAAAVGRDERTALLSSSKQSHALPSLYREQEMQHRIAVVPLNKIIASGRYGLKIDIEGAECEFTGCPEIICGAEWIVGELHYTGEPVHDADVDSFWNVIADTFKVEMGRPVVYFVDDQPVLCRSFKATRRDGQES